MIISKSQSILRNILKEDDLSVTGQDTRRVKIPSFLYPDFLVVQPALRVRESDLFSAELLLKRYTGVSTLYERTASAGFYDVVVTTIEVRREGQREGQRDEIKALAIDSLLPPTQIFIDILRGSSRSQTM